MITDCDKGSEGNKECARIGLADGEEQNASNGVWRRVAGLAEGPASKSEGRKLGLDTSGQDRYEVCTEAKEEHGGSTPAQTQVIKNPSPHPPPCSYQSQLPTPGSSKHLQVCKAGFEKENTHLLCVSTC